MFTVNVGSGDGTASFEVKVCANTAKMADVTVARFG